MNKKTVLIPLASLAAISAAALLTIGSPTAPAPECVQINAVEIQVEPPRRFARPPAPPMPVPHPHALPVG